MINLAWNSYARHILIYKLARIITHVKFKFNLSQQKIIGLNLSILPSWKMGWFFRVGFTEFKRKYISYGAIIMLWNWQAILRTEIEKHTDLRGNPKREQNHGQRREISLWGKNRVQSSSSNPKRKTENL